MEALADILQEILAQLPVVKAEATLIITAVALIIVGLFTTNHTILKLIYGLGILSAFIVLPRVTGEFFNGQYLSDGISIFLKRLFLLAGILVMLYREETERPSEYLFLFVSLMLGSFLMVSASNFLLLYLAIEITSYSAYFLTGFRFDKKSSEGAFKYYLFGAVSSAIMLFGISLIYGATGSLDYTAITNVLGHAGFLLMLMGLLFKTSVVPFHLWTPGTYEAGPTQAVALFSVVPKLAGFGVIYQLFSLNQMRSTIVILLVLAILTIIWGTFSAIRQENAKRLISYGAIAHSGFILPLVLIDKPHMLNAFGYYAVIYALMNLSIFYFISIHEKNDIHNTRDYAGLGKVFPLLGVAGIIIFVSLVGLPPTGGFTAKLLLFTSVFRMYEWSQDAVWLTYFAVGILSSAVSLFYYFRIPYYYFLKDKERSNIVIGRVEITIATFFGLALFWIFIWPDNLDKFVTVILASQ